MKKQLFSSIIAVIGCLLILLISACGDVPDDDSDDNNTDDDEYGHPITSYTHLEEALAKALGKTPGEEITPDELATLTHLTLPPPRSPGPLARFVGWPNMDLLAYCINLKELDLSHNGISDFSWLARLTRLEQLNLRNTVISDLQPIAGLVNLQKLDLSVNQVNDLTALAGMIQLKELNLQWNQIHDITPLVNLIQIKELYLQHNQIRDITPLANLIQINKLNLQDNMIVDLKPLVDNLGLVNENPGHLEEDFGWAGDTVTLSGNPLSDVSINVYIPALQARGVTVR